MQRLTGIGVSPGAVCGRAVILIQRAQVLRYQIAPGRVSEELARLDRSRRRCREQLQDIRARVSRRRGPDLASLFDAQLLMVEDPMLVPRAEAQKVLALAQDMDFKEHSMYAYIEKLKSIEEAVKKFGRL